MISFKDALLWPISLVLEAILLALIVAGIYWIARRTSNTKNAHLFPRTAAKIAIPLILLGYFAFRFFAPTGDIKKIDSFAQAADILNRADKNTLVVFDVDDTLIMPASKIFWPRVQQQNAEWLNTTAKAVFEREKKPQEFYTDVWRMTELPIVIEPSIIETIKALQNRGVMVLALTALDTGGSDLIPSFPEWRLKTLRAIGIDFSKTTFPDISFDELPKGRDGKPPVLYHGILCSSSVSKGEVLGAFLDHMQWKPDRVIFFDDNMKRVEQVAQEMRKRSIPFYGFQYLGGEHMPGELDKEVALTQLNHLLDAEEWISEDEAHKILANTASQMSISKGLSCEK